jgi:ABC-type multidrug transport system fused ATPase/permease subunit
MWVGLIKAPVFGLIIALAGCYQGMQVKAIPRRSVCARPWRWSGDLHGHRARRVLRGVLHRSGAGDERAFRPWRRRHPHYEGDFPIVVEGLRNAFGDHVIHEGLDLKVRRGEILGVVGGSGTGKSVLMRSIIGLQPDAGGRIEVLGESITGDRADDDIDIRARWGVLFQGGALFSTLTVGENVEVPLKEFYPEISPRCGARSPATR